MILLTIAGVAVTTFRWAEIRGFPARDPQGHLRADNVVRSIVMTGIMTFAVIFAGMPLFGMVVKVAQHNRAALASVARVQP
ncbi:MAG: hypothetical protein JWM35_42 [Verrucomicrobia bacterium]|nr:hypothetical protein [Verrucomicrobiota bacterium]